MVRQKMLISGKIVLRLYRFTDKCMGGLVGYHGGDIENSYNIGKVECTKDFINGNLVNKLNKTEHTWKQGKTYPILDWE